MSVVMKGGTSGTRESAIAPGFDGSPSQPVLNTATNAGNPSVKFQAEKHRPNMPQTATPDFMPSGGTIPEGSSDVMQQDVANLKP